MALLPIIDTGTATVAASGTAVTGTGTGWAARVRPGDLFGVHKGFSVPIASVDSDTSLTLAYPWPGAAQTGAAYAIMPFSPGAELAASTRELVEALRNGNLAAIADVEASANTFAYFTGSGTADLTALTPKGRSILAVEDAAGLLAELPDRHNDTGVPISNISEAVLPGLYVALPSTAGMPSSAYWHVKVVGSTANPAYYMIYAYAVTTAQVYRRQVVANVSGAWERVYQIAADLDPLYKNRPQAIMGNSGVGVAAGQTRFMTHGILGENATVAYVPVPVAGRFSALTCVTGGAPGAGQSWTFTLQNLFSDTALSCVIAGTLTNEGADYVNSVHFAAQDRWCLKMVASAGAVGSGNVLFSMIFTPD